MRLLVTHRTPDIDQRGKVQDWIASIFDISDRAHAARDRGRLASIADDAIVSKDVDGVTITWNRGAARIFGYSANEAVGKPITMLIPPDLQDKEPRILEHIRRGERIDHCETKRCHKDGRLLDLTMSPVKDADGQMVGASKVARDITNQKRAQEIEETLIRQI